MIQRRKINPTKRRGCVKYIKIKDIKTWYYSHFTTQSYKNRVKRNVNSTYQNKMTYQRKKCKSIRTKTNLKTMEFISQKILCTFDIVNVIDYVRIRPFRYRKYPPFQSKDIYIDKTVIQSTYLNEVIHVLQTKESLLGPALKHYEHFPKSFFT